MIKIFNSIKMSTLINNLYQAWMAQNPILFTPPRILLAIYNKKWYITIDDSKTVFLFLSDVGQVYAAPGFKCKETQMNGINIYNIDEPEALQIISCSKSEFSPLSGFAIRNLLGIVFVQP